MEKRMNIGIEEAYVAVKVGKTIVDEVKKRAKEQQRKENYILHRCK